MPLMFYRLQNSILIWLEVIKTVKVGYVQAHTKANIILKLIDYLRPRPGVLFKSENSNT